MKKQFILPVAIGFLLASCGNKLFKEAEKQYGNYEYSSAAKLYENLLKTTADNTAMLHLADCYRHMNRHSEAETWYAKAIKSPEATAADKANYAEVLQEEGKYDEAAAFLGEYLRENPGDAAAQSRMNACKSPAQFNKVNVFYTIAEVSFQGLAVNSAFSPFILDGKLYITSAAAAKPGVKNDNITGNGFLDIYSGDAGSLSLSPVSGVVNSNLHESNAVLSADGNTMYFTRSKMDKNKPGRAADNDNHFEICTAAMSNGAWSSVTSLPFNSKEFSCGHPALTTDGKRLYFVSDMPGGKGGTDIYYSDLNDGTWSAPVNVQELNTSGNEMFPTIHKDEFYFSSDGMPGAGGLDIFKCAFKENIPSAPTRLAAPFNSSADDFGLIYNDDRSGYFCSNRDQADGSDHVYSFKRRDPNFFVKATIKDKASGELLKNMSVEIKNTTKGTDSYLTTDESGSIVFSSDSLISYVFCIHDPAYFACFGGGTTPGFTGNFNDTTYLTLTPEKIVINKPIRLENIYYDYNKWNIRPDAAVELDKLVKIMQDNPQIKIELSSHTDSRGGDAFNMRLSQKRAQSAVDYIVSKGISKDRITAKGYGESVPLNRCVNGVKCSEEEFQFNRRTEFKVTRIIQ